MLTLIDHMTHTIWDQLDLFFPTNCKVAYFSLASLILLVIVTNLGLDWTLI